MKDPVAQPTAAGLSADVLEERVRDRAARKRWEDAKFYEMGLAMAREEGRKQGLEEALAQRFAQNRALGQARALLIVLEARQLEVTEDDRKRILATTDAEQLDRMMRRAATATTTAEIFE
jgi:hypothetical protein